MRPSICARVCSRAWSEPPFPCDGSALRQRDASVPLSISPLRPPNLTLSALAWWQGEITALVMPTNGVTNGPCNTSNPSHITAWLGHTAALTLSCVSPGQDAGVAPPGRRLPAPLPPRQGNRPSFYPVLPTPREARIGETQIPFGGSRSHRAAAPAVADRHQLFTAPRAAAAA